MDEMEKQSLLAKAARLEAKMLFVKAGDISLSLMMRGNAAEAYEKGGAYDKAIAQFEKLGKNDDADRCRAKRDEGRSGKTWSDEQVEFQKDKGNPY